VQAKRGPKMMFWHPKKVLISPPKGVQFKAQKYPKKELIFDGNYRDKYAVYWPLV
jgi:hypothetical protein